MVRRHGDLKCRCLILNLFHVKGRRASGVTTNSCVTDVSTVPSNKWIGKTYNYVDLERLTRLTSSTVAMRT